ncbi:hypothetical protein JN080_28655, partial [Bacillus sp. EB600]|nr:hypothetical protein [Bacillus sp. EB600]
MVNNTLHHYIFDPADRLVKVTDSNNNELNYNYDLNNNISSVSDKINNTTHTTNYSYDGDDKLTKTTYGSNEYDNNYDSLGGLNNSVIKTGI